MSKEVIKLGAISSVPAKAISTVTSRLPELYKKLKHLIEITARPL